MQLARKFTVLLLVSKKYSSLTEGFIYFYEKNWPFKEIPLIISHEGGVDLPKKYKAIEVHGDTWSKRLKETLEFVSSDYIIVFLEDYWIINKVNTKVIEKLLFFFDYFSMDHLYRVFKGKEIFFNHNKIQKKEKLKFVRLTRNQSTYQYFIGAGEFFKKSVLSNILNENENPWEFEDYSGKRYHDLGYDKNYRYILKTNPFGYPFGGIISKGNIRGNYEKILKKNMGLVSIGFLKKFMNCQRLLIILISL